MNRTTPGVKRTHIVFGNQHDAVILLKKGRTWQMLYWDTENDKVTPGQWLTQTTIHLKDSFLRNGLFYYSCLQVGRKKSYARYSIVSRPPFFTALTIGDDVLNRSVVSFAEPEWAKSPSTFMRQVPRMQLDDRVNPRGKDNSSRGRAVRIERTTIYVSNRKLVDLSTNAFEFVAPPKDYFLCPRQVKAAHVIWRHWCTCRDNPSYAICKKRLCREFEEMKDSLNV